MRSGVELWLENESLIKLQQLLDNIKQSTFVHFGDRTINTADIVGIFTPEDMVEHTHRKNGHWKCENEHWHDKFEKCDDCYINNLKEKYGE